MAMGLSAAFACPGRADWSTPAVAWGSVAAAQQENDEISRKVLALPLSEFRAFGYRPPPLPDNAPTPGKDIDISTSEIAVRDGTRIQLRLYKPHIAESRKLLFFNVHGGGIFQLRCICEVIVTFRMLMDVAGWVLGSPETEEAQNRFIAMNNKAVVVSVDYRRYGWPGSVFVVRV